MNLKKLGRTFWVIAAVAIMAMVLQGCGGDDDNGGGISPEDQARLDALDALEAEVPEGQELTVEYLMMLLGDAETLEELEAEVPEGQELTVSYLMGLIADSGALSDLDVDALEMALAALPEGMQELTAANLTALVTAYNMMTEAPPAQADADRAMGEALATALDTAKATVAATGLFDDDSGADFLGGTDDGITAMHDGDMVSVTITDTGDSRTGSFTKQMDGPMMIGGWDGSMWMRDPDAPEEADDEHDMMAQYAVVYTDIMMPTPMEANDANYTGTTVTAEGAVTIAADDASLAASDMFPAAPAMEGDTNEREYSADDTGTADVDESAEFAGTLQGGMGMFECTSVLMAVGLGGQQRRRIHLRRGHGPSTFDEDAMVERAWAPTT